MRKKIPHTLLLCLLTFASVAQGILSGKVTDENNEPLVGSNVLLKGKGIGQIADRSGNFRFGAVNAGNYIVEFSFIGYQSESIPVEIKDGASVVVKAALKPGNIQLSEVVVSSMPDRPVNVLSQMDIRLRPINTAQDVLRMVPGLFIAQHAGGGKAEQIFLRGFDCDHGTDINIEVDGLPVNMVSHAHGQGYADLHFLIPEMINNADFDKGPYFANKGDLNTAGYVAFQTKNTIRDFVKIEAGSFNTGRLAAGANVLTTKKTSAYVASEFVKTDGFFVNSQKFNRFNLQAKYTTQLTKRAVLTGAFTAFASSWNASGQIPDRAVAEGIITRYGSIDPTEGGHTSRYNSWLKLAHTFDNGDKLENQAFAIRYNFSLYSNFTFLLKDSINGDQINQRDGRWVYGYKTRYLKTSAFLGKVVRTEVGAGTRYDVVDNIALDHTVKRVFLNHIEYGNVRELNANAYVSETLFLNDKFSINAAGRVDYFYFSYLNKLTATQHPSVRKAIVNPKLNFNYQLSDNAGLFVRTGTGFHSNDARVVIEQRGYKVLPRASGIDVGADVKVTPQFYLHTALWRLDLDQEFVYNGDDGVVEPSGKTTRMGIDVSARYQLSAWLFADFDLNITRGREKGQPEGQNYIPLAPVRTSIGGLTIRRGYGFNGSLRYRTISDRPANSDYSLVATGYFICDALLNYTQRTYEIGFSIENILNTRWKEAQFDTESRLKNEKSPIDEINFTPGTPFSLKLRFTKYF